ncbi:unnamed protein product [Adineta steineri]|uniref:SH3 domain-containing protein n=1 Tax=Adineta steineri TaxID=433720 RepID=A0A818VZJ5_9BILA|nr:unnamed protein product [Adineta steineri]CAF3718205.1 unnamed protein product [Adineta steineri]
MLSHLRRGHHHEFDGNTMPTRTMNGHIVDQWKSSVSHGGLPVNYSIPRYYITEQINDRANLSPVSNNLIHDSYSARSNLAAHKPDLSRAFRADAYLLAIVRIEDKRNAFYSAEVVSKLRQKEQTQSFINKPCSLYVTDRSLIIFDRGTQVIAETIPLECVDPTCVHADVPDTLNDIFMYRILDQKLVSTTSQTSSVTSTDSSSVVVFKCSNNEARGLVDNIRTTTSKPLKHPKSAPADTRGIFDHRVDTYYGNGTTGGSGLMPQMPMESSHMNNSPYMTGSQRTITQQTTVAATDYYKHLTEELNKCFDDIELFVRYLEALMEYTKELERDHRRKEKKTTTGLKQMVEKIPDDRYFIDILQKFKHSFNLLGELKHIIHNPNAPELIHYLLSPLQFIIFILRTKHVNQLQLAQEIWTPALTKEAKELLLNCLTSKEHEILRNLGAAWVRTADDSTAKFSDYRPVFYEGRAVWIQDAPIEQPQSMHIQPARPIERSPQHTHPFTQFDERQQSVWSTTRQTNQINNANNGLTANYNTTFARQPSPSIPQFDTSAINRTTKTEVLDDYNAHMQNEHAWAIDRKRAGAKICAVKIDRKGHNPKELTVRRGELIEIEDSSKKWWRARNFHGDIGHVPNNIVEEIEIEHRPVKVSPSIPPGINSYRPISNTISRTRYN